MIYKERRSGARRRNSDVSNQRIQDKQGNQYQPLAVPVFRHNASKAKFFLRTGCLRQESRKINNIFNFNTKDL